MSTSELFSLHHDLEPGTVLVEASAGTGKTYSIAGLYIRMIYELGFKVESILVVTFTNAATAELKSRIRRRIQDAIAVTRDRLDNSEAHPKVDLPPAGRDEGLLRRDLQRLRAALEGFDRAAIHTIHGFCKRLLETFPFESEADTTVDYGIRPKTLVTDLVQDLYTTKTYDLAAEAFQELASQFGYNFDTLNKIADAIVRNQDASIYPAQALPFETLRTTLHDLQAEWTESWPETWKLITDFFSAEHGTPASQSLKQTKYKQLYAQAWFQVMPGWAEAGFPLLLNLDKKPKFVTELTWALNFQASMLRANINTAKNAPIDSAEQVEHFINQSPFFEQLETFLSAADAIRNQWAIEFAHDFKAHYHQSLEKSSTHSFDDLLRAISRPLEHSENDLQKVVQETFQAALIDEFQDTDETQWFIFEKLFQSKAHFLYLIGDPKQAIYRFRGANLHVYDRARRSANRIMTMDTNYRSDKAYNDAMNAMMDKPGLFITDTMAYIPIETPEHHHPRRILSKEPRYLAPVELQYLPSETDLNLNIHTAAIVASDIVAFLQSETQLVDEGDKRDVRPGDIAVLVNSNAQAQEVKEALDARGVPSVVGKAGHIFASDEALYLIQWLRALQAPQSVERVRTFAISPLLGATPDTLADPNNGANDLLFSMVAGWRDLFFRQGFISAFHALLTSAWSPNGSEDARCDVTGRVLSFADGERVLTNLQHLSELFHAVVTTEHLGLDGLIRWATLSRQDALQRDATTEDGLELRLETERNAVEIVTVHKSKGLEYPFVYAPYLGRGGKAQESFAQVCPDADDPTKRVINLYRGINEPVATALVEASKVEELQESMRRFYVALTRARLRLTLYWGQSKGHHSTPLSMALFGTTPDPLIPATAKDAIAASVKKAVDKTGLNVALQALQARNPAMHIREIEAPTETTYQEPRIKLNQLARAEFKRKAFDTLWKAQSYSGITERIGKSVYSTKSQVMDDAELDHDYDQSVEVEQERTSHFKLTISKPARTPFDADAPNVPFADFQAGANAGTFLHKLYEEIDFTVAKEPNRARVELDALIETWGPYHGLPTDLWNDALKDAFLATLTTPLGGPLQQRSLSDIGKRDRLDELEFHLPLAGGLNWQNTSIHTPINAASFAEAMKHRNDHQAVSIPESYFEQLAEGLKAERLAGFLKGFIDLVFRAKDPLTGQERWYVVDYKSNRIDPHRTKTYPIGHFAPEMLLYEMQSHHYVLQYHLYTVALHRFLESRLKDRYDYETHFGGVYYLFFRGMLGPDAPIDPGPGVFFDRPSLETTGALSELFSKDAPAARPREQA